MGCFGNNGCNDTCDNNLIEPRNTCDCGCDTRHSRESHHNYPTYGNCNTCGCESENN